MIGDVVIVNNTGLSSKHEGEETFMLEETGDTYY
jgi:hypothetical protein